MKTKTIVNMLDKLKRNTDQSPTTKMETMPERKKHLMPACGDKRIQEGIVRKGPLAIQHLRHATEMQGKKVWAKISAEEKSLSLVCSAQFAFHTRKQQHHIEFGLNQVLKNVHDSKLSLELIILCVVVSPFQSLWFLKTLRVALIAFIEVQ